LAAGTDCRFPGHPRVALKEKLRGTFGISAPAGLLGLGTEVRILEPAYRTDLPACREKEELDSG
jgi:hypothetical protein